MEKDISKIVSINLTRLRKKNKLTQLELATRFNFSDKTISKWESGDSLPSIDVLCALAEFYGITLNDLIDADLELDEPQKEKENDATGNKVTIAMLAISLVWLVATLIYVYVKINTSISEWTVFIWAVPASTILSLLFNGIWGNRKVKFILLSILLWSLLTSIYLQALNLNLWPLFIVGVPAQLTIILWSRLKPKQKKRPRGLI